MHAINILVLVEEIKVYLLLLSDRVFLNNTK